MILTKILLYLLSFNPLYSSQQIVIPPPISDIEVTNKDTILAQLDRVYVGELREKWQFPSDHLPIGVTIENEHLVSWNVLNTAYMGWVINNSQGLVNSLISDENVVIEENGLTTRDVHVAKLILEMITSSSHPRSILCLQECSEALILELRNNLPKNMKLLRSFDHEKKDQDIIVYDANKFRIIAHKTHLNAYPCEPFRPLQEALFEKDGVHYRIFNAHIPGDPNKPARYEFAKIIFDRKQKNEVTIALGDLNFDQDEMDHAFNKVAKDFYTTNVFTRITPYRTNIGPDFHSKAIDHIFIDLGENNLTIKANQCQEVLKGLDQTVFLLSEKSD